MSHALLDAMADLHEIAPAEVSLGDFGRPEGFMERQLRRWTEQSERTRTASGGHVDELASRLATCLPVQQRSTIVHGDYRLDNCVMDLGDPGRVRAVLDWEMSTLGDPLSDLGLLLFYWREAGEEQALLTPSVTVEGGFESRRALAERYAQRTGADLEHLSAYVAFAHFKFAVIAQGIAARVAAGAMADQDFGEIGAEVDRIAMAGLAVLQERG
jgi:aminoglycoside phosphotransferase (APT) family kinase protein